MKERFPFAGHAPAVANPEPRPRRRNLRWRPDSGLGEAGFTLIELMIVVVVIGILSAIAYPAYTNYTVKSRRVAAEACLSTYANYMERYYTTNLSYKRDGAGTVNTGINSLDCQAQNQTGAYYTYQLPASSLSTATYTIKAYPQGQQSSRDSGCGTLSLDQSGTRNVSGPKGVDACW